MTESLDSLKRRVQSGISRRKEASAGTISGEVDRFTERAKRALEFAQEEARRLRHEWMGTEHLLLGLLRERDGLAGVALTRLGLQLADVRAKIEETIGVGQYMARGAPQGAIGVSPGAKKALALAGDERRAMSHAFLGTEHLLLGVMRVGEGVGAETLVALGLSIEQVRQTVRDLLSERGVATGGGPTAPKSNVVTCRLDDRAVEALDALVEAGIRSTRSDAAAWLINAGMQAHQPLFDRVEATIQEIRRLRAEAQRLAQPTGAEDERLR